MFLGQYVRYTVVFACADRFFITRRSARVRGWSSIRTARRLIGMMCIVWLILASHIPIFMTIRNSTCWMFDSYKFFYPIYQTTVVRILPPVLMTVFGILTVRTRHQRRTENIHVRQKDRDLMRMLITEIFINVSTSITFSGNLLYGTATFFVMDKSPLRIEIEAFVNFLSQFLIHLLSVAPFYLFIISSNYQRNLVQIHFKTWSSCSNAHYSKFGNNQPTPTNNCQTSLDSILLLYKLR